MKMSIASSKANPWNACYAFSV